MDVISKSAINLVSIAFILSIIHYLINDRDKGRIRFVSGLILTVYMLQLTVPIIKLVARTDFLSIENTDHIEIDEEKAEENLIKAASAQICNDIKTLIVNRYDLSPSSFNVSVTVEKTEDKEIILKAITVHYYANEDITDTVQVELIAKYISDVLATPCTVLIEKIE